MNEHAVKLLELASRLAAVDCSDPDEVGPVVDDVTDALRDLSALIEKEASYDREVADLDEHGPLVAPDDLADLDPDTMVTAWFEIEDEQLVEREAAGPTCFQVELPEAVLEAWREARDEHDRLSWEIAREWRVL